MKPYWFVQVLEGMTAVCYEITVIKSDNSHGQKSYGWYDETKLLVINNTHREEFNIYKHIRPTLVKRAEQYAKQLNQGKSYPTVFKHL